MTRYVAISPQLSALSIRPESLQALRQAKVEGAVEKDLTFLI